MFLWSYCTKHHQICARCRATFNALLSSAEMSNEQTATQRHALFTVHGTRMRSNEAVSWTTCVSERLRLAAARLDV